MSRRYWLPIIALVGLIFCVGGYLGYCQLQRSETDPYADANYQPARNPSFPKGWPETYDANATGYEPNCQKPANREDSDLCAQWSAVKVVGESNRLSRVALNVNAIGLGALLFSLLFTGWAAWAAARAANSSDRALGHAKATSAIELRAYLNTDSTQIVYRPDYITHEVMTDIVFKNFGSTPAHAVECAYTIYLRDEGLDVVFLEKKRELGSIGPSATFSIREEIRMSVVDRTIETMEAGETKVVIEALVRYKTVFDASDVPRRETESFLINGPGLGGPMRGDTKGFHMIPDGNAKNRST